MKKVTALLLTLAMLFSLSVPAFATADNPAPVSKVVREGGYTFEVEETITPDYAVNRSYHNPNANARSIPSKEETFALLAALGLSEDAILAFPEGTLQEIAVAEDMHVSVSYSKYNEETDVITPLSEEQALEEALIVNESQNNYGDISVYAQSGNGYYADTYMQITHTAVHMGGGKYKYTAYARWLTMPYLRSRDSIGCCASYCSFTPGSASGYYSYTTVTTYNGSTTSQSSGRIDIPHTSTASLDIFTGYAGVFKLPVDMRGNPSEGEADIVRKDLKAYFEYGGNVSTPGDQLTFNSCGSYYHSRLEVSATPYINISRDELSFSIGLDSLFNTEKRAAYLQVFYNP